ncbi:MAG TPA: phytanoyl-CoA dioxygenase family protein [Opitutaceae bacterium]|nr:phytanoyl-CoA dioxygenase family protein [Opitutaceae bacterium]
MSDSVRHTAAASYARDGFVIAPPVIPAELLARVRRRIDAVYAGEYETGIPPVGNRPGKSAPPTRLEKIDNAHASDRTIREVVSHPAVGEWAAALTGARWVQVFATQLLIKPPGRQDGVNVGWHQDYEYWDTAFEGDLFTAWIAISDVTLASGPMRFVPGSHQWGLLKAGDFFSSNLDAIKQRIQERHGSTAWHEVPAVLPPGAMSFHHRLVVHGSGPNESATPRVSFAVHLRTDQSRLKPGVRWQDVPYLHDLDNPERGPVCYRSGQMKDER